MGEVDDKAGVQVATGQGAPPRAREDLPDAPQDGSQSPPPRAWGAPLAGLDRGWVRVEQALCVTVLVAEIAALCVGVALTGLSAHYEPGSDNIIGVIFRGFVSAVVLGLMAHLTTCPKSGAPATTPWLHPVVVTASIVVGLFLGRQWANGGVDYASNLRAWMQNASVIMLVGGLRGLVTRLTLLLALLGASMATSSGKHINIDVAARYIPLRLVAPVAITGWLAAAFVCFAGTWGFVDGIAVTKFDAEAFRACQGTQGEGAGHLCDTPVSDRLATTRQNMARDLFLFGRQLSLDVRAFPKVIAGDPYDKWMTGAEWNTWLQNGQWDQHYPKESVDALYATGALLEQTRMPAVTAPGANDASGLLIRDLNFVFPFGLFVIGLKFLLRILLVLSGHVRIDFDSAHGDDEAKHFEHGGGPPLATTPAVSGPAAAPKESA